MKYSKEWEEIRKYFLYFLSRKEFQKIINFNQHHWIENIKKLIWEELIHYNLLVWVAYQEVWELEKAEVYFDNYLSLVSPDTINNYLTKKWITKLNKANDEVKKFAMLCFEIERLGFKYIDKK